MSDFFTSNAVGPVTVVEFQTESLMAAHELDQIGAALYRLVEVDGHKLVLMDFGKVRYLSSQAIGIVMAMRKKISAIKGGKFVLCCVGSEVQQLLKITGLEKLLTIKPTQKDGLKAFE